MKDINKGSTVPVEHIHIFILKCKTFVHFVFGIYCSPSNSTLKRYFVTKSTVCKHDIYSLMRKGEKKKTFGNDDIVALRSFPTAEMLA